jgi:hypothetical protein
MSIDEFKVFPVGGQNIIHVPEGRGEELRLHLESHGIRSQVSPAAEAGFERLEVDGAEDPVTLQAIVDQWER